MKSKLNSWFTFKPGVNRYVPFQHRVTAIPGPFCEKSFLREWVKTRIAHFTGVVMLALIFCAPARLFGDNITATVTVDNGYAFGFGDVNGIYPGQFYGGVDNCSAGAIFNSCYVFVPPDNPSTDDGPEIYYITNASSTNYIYIVAWSDDQTYQGTVASFTDNNTGVTVTTSPAWPWQVFATGTNWAPNCSDSGTHGPPLTGFPYAINNQIAIANSSAGGPGSSVTWVGNVASANGRLDFSGQFGHAYPGSVPSCIGSNAVWMEYNPEPTNFSCNPFIWGSTVDYTSIPNFLREYLIYRIGPVGQIFTTTNTCTNGCITIYNPNDIVVTTCSNSMVVNFTVGVSDACCSNCVTVVSSPPSGYNFPLGTTTVTSTATDGLGDTNICTFTVTVIQNTNPPVIFSCPTNIDICIVSNGCGVMPDITSEVLATNALGGNVAVTQSIPPGTSICSDTDVTFTATDACGDTAQTNVPCTLINCSSNCLEILCPSNIVVTTCSNCVPVTYSATAIDPCCTNGVSPISNGVTLTYYPPSGSCFPPGTNVVEVTAIDGCSNTATCFFTVTVLSCTNCCGNCSPPYPLSYSVTISPGGNYLADNLCQGTNAFTGFLTNAPNGSEILLWNGSGYTVASTRTAGVWNPSLSLDPGDGFVLNVPSGTPPFTVTISGCQPLCPPPCMPTNGLSFIGTLGIITNATWTNLFSCPPPCGAEMIIWNSTSQSFTTYEYINGVWTPSVPVLAVGQSAFVTVTNCPCLQVTCPTNKTVECGSAWIFDLPAATSCCSSNVSGTMTNVLITPISTVTNGSCPWFITRTWQISDGCGDAEICTQLVTVVDTTPPTLTCATNKTVPCGTAWSFDPPTAHDACCSNVTITVVSTVTNVIGPCAISYTRTWQATDCCSNTATCSQTVTVANELPPILNVVCVTNIYFAGGSNGFTIPVPSSPSTNLLDYVVSHGVTSFKQFDECSVNSSLIHTFSDLPSCITSATLTMGIKVCGDIPTNDDVSLLFTGPAGSLSTSNQWSSSIGSRGSSPGILANPWDATDYPNEQVITLDLGNLPNGGGSLISDLNEQGFLDFYLEDDTGVDFLRLRVVSCCCSINKTVPCGSNWSFDVPSAVDACSGAPVPATVLSTVTNGVCPQYITRTWLFTDDCGNSNTCSQTVTVVDTTPPMINCPSNIVVSSCTNIPVFYTPTATDTCSGSNVTVECNPPSGSLFIPGTTTTVTCTAADACGNSNACSFTVTVLPCMGTNCIDLVCPADIAVTTCDTNCAIVNFAATATDFCCTNGVALTYNHAPGTCFPLGTTMVNVKATDRCGNSNGCSFTVTVSPGTNSPVILSGPTNVTICEGTQASGAVIVDSDEWALSDQGYSYEGDGATYALNAAAYLTGNQTHGTNILIYSDNFSLNGSDLTATLTSGGYNVTHILPPNPLPASLNPYSAVFLAGDALSTADIAELQDFVCGGGGVYIAAGTGTIPGGAAAEAAQWNSLLNTFGLDMASNYNLLIGNYAVPSPLAVTASPLMAGVSHIWYWNGNDVSVIPGHPLAHVVATYGSQGFIGVSACATAAGNCGLMPDLTGRVVVSGGNFTQSIPPGTLVCTNTDVVLTVTNACGESTNLIVPVTLVNCASNCLQIQCWTNIVVTSCTNVPVYYYPTATDNCCSNWGVMCSPASGSYFGAGTTNVTCLATDSCGNASSCIFTVTVNRGAAIAYTPSEITVCMGTNGCGPMPDATTNVWLTGPNVLWVEGNDATVSQSIPPGTILCSDTNVTFTVIGSGCATNVTVPVVLQPCCCDATDTNLLFLDVPATNVVPVSGTIMTLPGYGLVRVEWTCSSSDFRINYAAGNGPHRTQPQFTYGDAYGNPFSSGGYHWLNDPTIGFYNTNTAVSVMNYTVTFTFLNGAPDPRRLFLGVDGLYGDTTTATVSQPGYLAGEYQASIPGCVSCNIADVSAVTLLDGVTETPGTPGAAGTQLSSAFYAAGIYNRIGDYRNTGRALFQVATNVAANTLTLDMHHRLGDGLNLTLAYAVTSCVPVIVSCPTNIGICYDSINGCGVMPDDTSKVQAMAFGGGNVTVTQSIPPGTPICSATNVTFTVTDACGDSVQTNVPCFLKNCGFVVVHGTNAVVNVNWLTNGVANGYWQLQVSTNLINWQPFDATTQVNPPIIISNPMLPANFFRLIHTNGP